jgi:hypothetical protein
MVTPKPDRFLIDAAFIVERTEETFYATPLLTAEGRDYTFTFGCLRDFLRLRRKLGITLGMLLLGKETHSLTSPQNINDLTAILKQLNIPYVHDSLNCSLQVAHSIGSRFSHIVTSDRRFLQLCANDCIVILPRKGGQEWDWLSSETVTTEIGIAAKDVPTYLALTDASNAAGLTSTQAARLVELYGNIDSIYANVAQVRSVQIRRKLAECEARIRQCYAEGESECLEGSIDCTAKDGSLNDLDTANNRQLLRSYGFHSLLSALSPNSTDVRPVLRKRAPRSESYHAAIDRKGMQELESVICRSKLCSIDAESDDKDPREGTLLGISFSVKDREAYFVPLIENYLKGLTKNDVLGVLSRVLNSDVDFIGHNIKYDYLLLRRAGLSIRRLHFDTMLAAYDCHGDWQFFNLPYLAKRLLGKEIKSYRDVVGKGFSFLDLPFREMMNHGCQDADATLRLYAILSAQLEERGITWQFLNQTMPLLQRLGSLEFDGMAIDVGRIDRIRRNLVKQVDRLKSDICKIVGRVIDLESHLDLSDLVREAVELREPIGLRRISLPMLEQLAISNPVVRLIVEYKRLRNKVGRLESVSTTVVDGKIYPLFNQIKSRTGLVVTSAPTLFDAETLPELKPCFQRSVRDLFPDTQRSLDKLAQMTKDSVLLRIRAGRSKVDPVMAKHPLMQGLNHDSLLVSLVIGQSDVEISKRFFVERWRIVRLRHDVGKRYQVMFRWLNSFRRLTQRNGYASNGNVRKYIDGLKSSDIARRGHAIKLAVRWLIGV